MTSCDVDVIFAQWRHIVAPIALNEMFKNEDYFTLTFVQHINVPYNGYKSDLKEYCNTILSVLAFFPRSGFDKSSFLVLAPRLYQKKIILNS